jgi:hypothetical protein
MGGASNHYDFMTDRTETIDTDVDTGSALGGHGGGDYWLMRHFSQALLDEDQTPNPLRPRRDARITFDGLCGGAGAERKSRCYVVKRSLKRENVRLSQ